jgi:peptidoglycan hydrolase CwlO-like protein
MYENLDKHQTENAVTMKKLHADIKTKDSIIKTLRIDLVTTTEDFEKLLETAKEKQAQAEVIAEQEKENNLAYKESEA